MSRKTWITILVVIGVLCIGGALWYPISYQMQRNEQQEQLDELRSLRGTAESSAPAAQTAAAASPKPTAQAAPAETAPAETISAETETAEPAPVTSPAPADALPAASPAAGAEPTATAHVIAADAPEETTADGPEEEKIVELPVAEKHDVETTVLSEDEIEARLLPSLRPLYERNHDLIGWLTIPGAEVDHPVMQTPEENGYYLYRSFDGADNKNGTLFLDATCDVFTPSRNLIIYGHNMRSGLMFGHLTDYLDPDYWREHRLIRFDSLIRERTYVVVACVQSTAGPVGQNGNFRYTAAFEDEADLNSWLDTIRRRRRYDTGIDFGTEDRYLTLSTCAYHAENGRLLVIARELRPGEDAEHPEGTDGR